MNLSEILSILIRHRNNFNKFSNDELNYKFLSHSFYLNFFPIFYSNLKSF